MEISSTENWLVKSGTGSGASSTDKLLPKFPRPCGILNSVEKARVWVWWKAESSDEAMLALDTLRSAVRSRECLCDICGVPNNGVGAAGEKWGGMSRRKRVISRRRLQATILRE